MWDCIKTGFKNNLPVNLDLWLLGILIGCIIAGVFGAVGGPVGAAAVLVACLAALGITLVGSAIIAAAQAVWDCF